MVVQMRRGWVKGKKKKEILTDAGNGASRCAMSCLAIPRRNPHVAGISIHHPPSTFIGAILDDVIAMR